MKSYNGERKFLVIKIGESYVVKSDNRVVSLSKDIDKAFKVDFIGGREVDQIGRHMLDISRLGFDAKVIVVTETTKVDYESKDVDMHNVLEELIKHGY